MIYDLISGWCFNKYWLFVSVRYLCCKICTKLPPLFTVKVS